jgi:ArsR family transcriptional regulator, arsenate/arsenite/antimonite-responsive transcriptional repressor
VAELALLETCCPLGQPTLSEDEATELELLFKALADRHRVRIVNMLAGAEEPVCVCHLEPMLGLSQPTVSYHLKQLLDAGLLQRQRRGRFMHYRLADGALARLGELVRGSATVEATTT